MKKSRWVKAVAGCMAIAVPTVTLAITSNWNQVTKLSILGAGAEQPVYADTLNVSVDFYDYNIKTYKGKKVDTNTKIALNAYEMDQFVNATGSSVTADRLFLFGGNRLTTLTGAHNVWTGNGRSQYEGIVEQYLENGNIAFNDDGSNPIYGVNIFPGRSDTTLEDAGVVEAYYNTNFQFMQEEDSTYVYDSGQYTASGLTRDENRNGSLNIDFTQKGPKFASGTGSNANRYGFFPFNKITGADNSTSEDRHHMFGMKMALDFFMPLDGKITTDDGEKKDMIFKFSGDDDVWVFVDGCLALDLGGIHDTISGEINFASGDVVYQKSASGGKSYNVENIYDSYEGKINQKQNSKHTLTMFYLERGEYDSNCKITFNLLQERDLSTPTPVPTETPEITVTPVVTTSPAITTEPAVTATPDVTETPEITATPALTEAPVITETPSVEKTPEPKTTPKVEKTPEPKETPSEEKTPEPKETPSVENTLEPTETPKATDNAVETPKVTVTPEITNEPEKTEMPMVPKEDDVIEEEPTETPVEIIEDTMVPNDPVVVPTTEPLEGEVETPEPEGTPEEKPTTMPSTKVTATPKATEKPEVITDVDVPSTLPQTGAIGRYMQTKNKTIYFVALLPIALIAAGATWMERKRRK